MKPAGSPDLEAVSEEVSELIETLLRTGQRLEELTAGEVDTVSDRDGRTFLLGSAQAQLRHSEAAKQAAILNALPAHIALVDARGFIISVNEAWRRFALANDIPGAGYGVGRGYLEICDCAQGAGSSDARQVAEGIRSVLGGQAKTFSIEYPCHSPTEQRWFLLTVTPLDDDRPNGAVIMHLNITEQKRAKDELRESDRRLNDMLANVDLISLMLDREARITHCNDFLLRLTDWRREEVIGRDWFEQFIPPGPVDMMSMFRALLADPQFCAHYENEILTRSGRKRLIRWNNTLLHSVSGEVIGTASIGEDITERRDTEARLLQKVEELRQSEERFRQITGNIHEVFWILDPGAGQMLYVSPAYEQIWGRTCESLYADPRSWLDSIHPDDRGRVMHAFEAQIAVGRYDERYRITRPDGSIRWIHDCGSPVRDAPDEVSRLVGVAEDITAQRQLEEQLRQSQKMEAIGTLAGGIAHDFNNLLAVIGGYTELLKASLAHDPEVSGDLDAVALATARAAALVKQILMFSRSEETPRTRLQLAPVVEEAVKFLRSTLPSTIEIRFTAASKEAVVLADATQIHQIVMNLGTNAGHAMQGRPGQLDVTLESVSLDPDMAELKLLRPGRYARLSVRDTGMGMDQATVARIFEPFFTTKPVGEGTGLGLAVVHGIMQSHAGAISVYSEPGQGSVFHLYLPILEGAASEAETGDGAIPHGHGERILFVDDELPLAKIGKRLLERLGYVVETHTNAAEALALVRAEPRRFDLLITDQTMPQMTGIDFARAVMQIRPDFPVILTTGYAGQLTLENLRLVGIRELLVKPQTVHALGTLVHRALSGQTAE